MHIYLSIDDTDNKHSPGSGQLAQILTEQLLEEQLALHCSGITRHQLFVHREIPYTSHNSAMCFSANIGDGQLQDLIEYSGQFLKQRAAAGSDPGLCVAINDEGLKSNSLVEFGLQAKNCIHTKEKAYHLARKLGIHLSEHGGTGDGIIGALAATGLRLQGSDGRFRGWYDFGPGGSKVFSRDLCHHNHIDGVIDDEGHPLAPDLPITLADNRTKAIYHCHQQVIPVTRRNSDNGQWNTLSGSEIKRF